jgi:hypothetical protein
MHDTVELILACMFRYKLYQCTNTGKIDFKRHQLTKIKLLSCFLSLSHLSSVHECALTMRTVRTMCALAFS